MAEGDYPVVKVRLECELIVSFVSSPVTLRVGLRLRLRPAERINDAQSNIHDLIIKPVGHAPKEASKTAHRRCPAVGGWLIPSKSHPFKRQVTVNPPNRWIRLWITLCDSAELSLGFYLFVMCLKIRHP
jgi:hypothetical protein